jgi:hypothetical protein
MDDLFESIFEDITSNLIKNNQKHARSHNIIINDSLKSNDGLNYTDKDLILDDQHHHDHFHEHDGHLIIKEIKDVTKVDIKDKSSPTTTTTNTIPNTKNGEPNPTINIEDTKSEVFTQTDKKQALEYNIILKLILDPIQLKLMITIWL